MKPNLLKMKEIALIYLDRSGGLQKFMNDCKLYNSDSKQSYAVFRFLILVNPSDITELDATFGNCVLHEPGKATQIFQSVCFTAVKTLSLIEQLQSEAQINIVLKVTHLPSLPSYILNLCKFPFDYTCQRFYMIEGIVLAMTIITKYTQGARFICSEETCQYSEGFHYVRVHTPGATESATLRHDFVCSLCTSPLREDMKYRVLGGKPYLVLFLLKDTFSKATLISFDKQVVEMIDTKAINALQGFSTSDIHFRFQSLTVFLRDELSNTMKIGNRYKVIGIPISMQSSSQVTLCLEANSVHHSSTTVKLFQLTGNILQPMHIWLVDRTQSLLPQWLKIITDDYQTPMTDLASSPSCISETFKYLLSLTSGSYWRFTAALAYNFASQILPPGIYNTLKLAILLSLVHTNDRDDSTAVYLDILAMTNDSLILERIMNYSVCLVPRGIRHILSSDIFPTVMKDKHATGTASIQAGSAILAQGGICFIGELSSHKKDKLEQLQSVLENRAATIFISAKKYGQDIDQQVTLPVQTSFWSFIDVDSVSRKHVQKDNIHIGQMDLNIISANLIDAFGLVIHCSESTFWNSSLPITNFLFKKAVGSEEAAYIASQQFTTQDYEDFLAFASHLQVELGSEAEKLIHGYYLASRRVRTHPVNGSHLSATSLKTLISLAEAHAKLSLRTQVLKEDVLIAVLLFESSLTLKHGASVFCVAPDAVFPFDLNDVNSLNQRDVYLKQCDQQLIQFIATYGPATHILSSED